MRSRTSNSPFYFPLNLRPTCHSKYIIDLFSIDYTTSLDLLFQIDCLDLHQNPAAAFSFSSNGSFPNVDINYTEAPESVLSTYPRTLSTFVYIHIQPKKKKRSSAREDTYFFTMSTTYTTKDVAEHKDEKQGGVWIIVDKEVYDVTGTGSLNHISSQPGPPSPNPFPISRPEENLDANGFFFLG